MERLLLSQSPCRRQLPVDNIFIFCLLGNEKYTYVFMHNYIQMPLFYIFHIIIFVYICF